MTREEYENEVREKIFDIKNEFDNKLLELHKELMAEFKEEEPSLDGWKVGDIYYFHDTTGNIITSRVDPTNSDRDINSLDMVRIKHGYAKRTKEEVQFAIERDAVLYELSKFAEPKDAVWDGITNHFYICYHYTTIQNKVSVDCVFGIKSNDIYFASKEDAKKAIAKVGEERVKRFYLEVEE